MRYDSSEAHYFVSPPLPTIQFGGKGGCVQSSNMPVVKALATTTCVKSSGKIIKGKRKSCVCQHGGEFGSTGDPCLKKYPHLEMVQTSLAGLK